MCKLLTVSTSGYYDWRDRPPSKREQENAILEAKIKEMFDDEHSRAGAKRVTKRLNLEGIRSNCLSHHGSDNKLIDAAKEDQCPYIYPFIVIGLGTSMRRMEILSIQLKNIDLARRVIFIPKAKAGAR